MSDLNLSVGDAAYVLGYHGNVQEVVVKSVSAGGRITTHRPAGSLFIDQKVFNANGFERTSDVSEYRRDQLRPLNCLMVAAALDKQRRTKLLNSIDEMIGMNYQRKNPTRTEVLEQVAALLKGGE